MNENIKLIRRLIELAALRAWDYKTGTPDMRDELSKLSNEANKLHHVGEFSMHHRNFGDIFFHWEDNDGHSQASREFEEMGRRMTYEQSTDERRTI